MKQRQINSMKQNQEIQGKVEEALQSLDGIHPASPQPWFYTRLMARLNRERTSVWSRVGSVLARPVIAVGSVCLILALNVFFLVSEPGDDNDVRVTGQVETVSDSESIIASTSSYEYENLVQP